GGLGSFLTGSTSHCPSLRAAGQQRWRHVQAERLGGLEIDSQFEFRWLLNGKISRLVSVENAGGVNANLAICVRKAGAIAYKAARCCELAPLIQSRPLVPQKKSPASKQCGAEVKGRGLAYPAPLRSI